MSAVASPTLSRVASLADSDLVRRAIRGRGDGFEELVRRYQRPIVSYVYRMTGDYESALDLTQDVFIKVYGSLARYRSEYKFSTWIYRIAHNTAIYHLRRQTTHEQELSARTPEGETYERPVASDAPTPEQLSERAERRAEIEDVIQQL